MNRQNIISAGKMMAIVVALLGAMFCGAALTPLIGSELGEMGVFDGNAYSSAIPANATGNGWLDAPGAGMFGIAPLYNLLFGAALIVFGLVMTTTFGATERHRPLAGVVLAVASLTALLGILAVVVVYRNPFSWMTAIVGMAIFIDALCLVISLKKTA